MKLFLIDIPGWATREVIVRAESLEHAEAIAESVWESVGIDGEVTELNPDGPPGVLWAHVNTPDTGDG